MISRFSMLRKLCAANEKKMTTAKSAMNVRSLSSSKSGASPRVAPGAALLIATVMKRSPVVRSGLRVRFASSASQFASCGGQLSACMRVDAVSNRRCRDERILRGFACIEFGRDTPVRHHQNAIGQRHHFFQVGRDEQNAEPDRTG